MLKRFLRNRIRKDGVLYVGFRRLRMFWVRCYWRLGDGVHSTCYIVRPRFLSSDLQAGAYTFVNYGCYICPGVSMGRYVMLAPEVWILGGDHRFNCPGVPIEFSGRKPVRRTVIEDDVWICARSMIRSGVRIGRGSIVAMGSVVVGDVEPYSIVSGNPARVVRYRFSGEDRVVHERMLGGEYKHVRFVGNEFEREESL